MAEEEKQEQEGQGEEPQTLSEEELRNRLEEEIRTLRVQDVVLQSIVSILNLSARRIAKEDERDLDQAKVGIDAVRALLSVLDEDQAGPVKQALSELQMLYAKQAGGGDDGQDGGSEEGEPEAGEGASSGREHQSKLWTPPDTA